jgi:hypothetical protein
MAHSANAVQSSSSTRQFIHGVIGFLDCIPLFIHQLLFRLAIASVFLPAGLLKLGSWESTVALFQDEYKVPVLAPAVAAALNHRVRIRVLITADCRRRHAAPPPCHCSRRSSPSSSSSIPELGTSTWCGDRSCSSC